MLRYLKYTFPASGDATIATVQVLGAGDSYDINGTEAAYNRVDFLSKGYCRQVSIHTAAGDFSAVNFTITGMQNGEIVQEVLAGPNSAVAAGYVYSISLFDNVESVTVDGVPGNCTIGTGYLGFFRLIQINRLGGAVIYSLSLESSVNANQIPTVVYTSVDNIEDISKTYQEIVTDNVSTLYTVKASSQVTQYSVQYPYTSALSIPAGAPAIPLLSNYYLVALNGTTATRDSAMTLIFTQV